MTKTAYTCGVKVATANGVPCGTGWYGVVRADSPQEAARIARGKHSASDSRAVGDIVTGVEVWGDDGGKIGDY